MKVFILSILSAFIAAAAVVCFGGIWYYCIDIATRIKSIEVTTVHISEDHDKLVQTVGQLKNVVDVLSDLKSTLKAIQEQNEKNATNIILEHRHQPLLPHPGQPKVLRGD
jgi:hypothetical protein